MKVVKNNNVISIYNASDIIIDKEVAEKIKPSFKQLTAKEINDIHKRGKITRAEKVKEWEKSCLCAPGDNIGSAAHRCKKFHYNCHNCLVDYSLGSVEHESIYSNLKVIKPYFGTKNKILKKVKKKD